MKKEILALLGSVLFTFNFFAQKERSVGISFASFGQNLVTYPQDIVGVGSYDSDYFYNIGVQYIFSLNDWLDMESGIEYAKHAIVSNPSIDPTVQIDPRKIDFSLLEIPVTLKANFLKDYAFAKAGALMDINLKQGESPDDFTGLGLEAGLGFQYGFNFGGTLYVNPYLRIHNLVPFTQENINKKLWENGVKVGLLFKLN